MGALWRNIWRRYIFGDTDGGGYSQGYQRNLDSDQDVLACIKHFCGGTPINGTNGAPADLSERTLREVSFLHILLVLRRGQCLL